MLLICNESYTLHVEKEMKLMNYEELNFEGLEELEEVVTPGWGTVGCC
ncbi:hypothetical protein [Cellulosilyticum ruminicola]|nr:hypothetical protein [Cellulosilyticum ruminicola]